MVTDKLLQRIRAHLASPGITKAGLAKAAGLHPNTLRDADRPDWNPTSATMKAIEPHLPPELDHEWPLAVDGEADSPRPFARTSSRTSHLEEVAADPSRAPSSPASSSGASPAGAAI